MIIGDVVVYVDNKWDVKLKGFYPFRTDVTRAYRTAMAPVEYGVKSIDNKVIDPITIKIVGKISRMGSDQANGSNWEGSGWETELAYRNLATIADDNLPCSVATTDGFYNNLLLTGVRLVGDSKELDQTEVEIEYTEILFAQGEAARKADPGNTRKARNGYISG